MKIKKIRNKNELSPKPKKPPEKKIVVRFSFIGIDLILSGRKTTAFHRHLYNPLCKEKVCVDSHVIKYFNVGKIIHITPNRYLMYENSIKKWAKKVNLLPSELQALLWLYSKQKYGINV